MLFSDPRISALIRTQFVAAWESVRPVPVVEIDFGNGKKLRRTVNGNIATYLCDPAGRVLDVIPGLNNPDSYLSDLQQALNLWRASLASFDKTVTDYHLANLSQPTVYVWVKNDSGKMSVERLMRVSLDKGKELADVRIWPRRPAVTPAVAGPSPLKLTEEESAILAADTQINRQERKPLLHKILSEKVVRPAEITKQLYKDVLHCDLDDPYLGLISGAFSGGAYEAP